MAAVEESRLTLKTNTSNPHLLGAAWVSVLLIVVLMGGIDTHTPTAFAYLKPTFTLLLEVKIELSFHVGKAADLVYSLRNKVGKMLNQASVLPSPRPPTHVLTG